MSEHTDGQINSDPAFGYLIFMIMASKSCPKPSEDYENYWTYADAPPEVRERGETYGKWLIFQKPPQIYDTWEDVSRRVESGELGATAAKVATMKENPNAYASKKDPSKVICVYTTERDIDEVGMRLVHVVKQTIRYKTDEATRAGIYIGRGYKRTTIKTIEWNRGKPFIKD